MGDSRIFNNLDHDTETLSSDPGNEKTGPDVAGIYNSDLDYYLHEYFSRRGIDIDMQFKDVPNNVFKSAFRYVYKNSIVFPAGIQLGNFNTPLLQDYNLLKKYTLFYINTVEQYNIISFITTYLLFTCIDENTFYNWKDYNIDNRYTLSSNYVFDSDNPYILYKSNNKEYRDILCSLKKDIYKTIILLGRDGVRGKLSDDRTGVVVLANNDREIGLEYEQKRVQDRIETSARVVAELPNLFNASGKISGV